VRVVALSILALGLLQSSVCPGAEPRACDEALLREEAHRARVWRYSWTGVNAALTVGSFALVPLVDAEERPDWVISGAGTAVTALATWFLPLRVESAEEELDALPAAARSRHLTRLSQESAEDEHDRVTWPWHLANFGLAAIPGGIIAFGYHHYESAVITTVVGTALGEAQLLTQPTRLHATCSVARCALVPRFVLLRSPAVQPSGGLLTVSGTF
jgi:hypothetical protein